MQKITTFLTYDNQAEQAATYYASIFDGTITSRTPGPDGSVFAVTFELFGQTFMAMNGGPSFAFAPGISLFVGCETQEEIDAYWEKLTAGGKEVRCGWLVDKFGVSWQIVPKNLPELLAGGRAVPAMMEMSKLDIAALKKARDGG